MWEFITKGYANQAEVLRYARGVDITEFFQPFEGEFMGRYYNATTPPVRRVAPFTYSEEVSQRISEDVEEECRWGAIRKMDLDNEPEPIVEADLIHVMNPRRTCWDGRYLNLWCKDSKFRMEVLDLLPRLCPVGFQIKIVTADHKKGYYHVAVTRLSQRYLTFRWKGVWYCYASIPFGWKNAPYCYTVLAMAVWRYLRDLTVPTWMKTMADFKPVFPDGACGIPSLSYLDDALIRKRFCADCSEDCAVSDAAFLFAVLATHLGWYFGRKSDWLPEFRKKFLGFIADCALRRFEVPTDKMMKFLALTREITAAEKVHFKTLESWRGKAMAMKRAVPAAGVFLRTVNEELARVFAGEGRTSMITVARIRSDLQQWLTLESWSGVAPWKPEHHLQLTLFTDASLHGYGAVVFGSTGERVEINLCVMEDDLYLQLQHLVSERIDWLEARALECALRDRNVQDMIQDQYVDVAVDNQNLLSALEDYKGGHFQLLNARVKEIFLLTLKLNAFLRFSYVNTKFNVADAPSRDYGAFAKRLKFDPRLIDHNSHKLAPDLFQALWYEFPYGRSREKTDKFRGFTHDTMASFDNVQCNPASGRPLPYFSREDEPETALGTNIFAQNLKDDYNHKRTNLFCNGPFILTAQLLAFFSEQGVRVTMVLPCIPDAPWWPIACGRCVPGSKKCIAKQGQKNVFFQQSREYKSSVGPIPWDLYVFLFDFRHRNQQGYVI